MDEVLPEQLTVYGLVFARIKLEPAKPIIRCIRRTGHEPTCLAHEAVVSGGHDEGRSRYQVLC